MCSDFRKSIFLVVFYQGFVWKLNLNVRCMEVNVLQHILVANLNLTLDIATALNGTAAHREKNNFLDTYFRDKIFIHCQQTQWKIIRRSQYFTNLLDYRFNSFLPICLLACLGKSG